MLNSVLNYVRFVKKLVNRNRYICKLGISCDSKPIFSWCLAERSQCVSSFKISEEIFTKCEEIHFHCFREEPTKCTVAARNTKWKSWNKDFFPAWYKIEITNFVQMKQLVLKNVLKILWYPKHIYTRKQVYVS